MSTTILPTASTIYDADGLSELLPRDPDGAVVGPTHTRANAPIHPVDWNIDAKKRDSGEANVFQAPSLVELNANATPFRPPHYRCVNPDAWPYADNSSHAVTLTNPHMADMSCSASMSANSHINRNLAVRDDDSLGRAPVVLPSRRAQFQPLWNEEKQQLVNRSAVKRGAGRVIDAKAVSIRVQHLRQSADPIVPQFNASVKMHNPYQQVAYGRFPDDPYFRDMNAMGSEWFKPEVYLDVRHSASLSEVNSMVVEWTSRSRTLRRNDPDQIAVPESWFFLNPQNALSEYLELQQERWQTEVDELDDSAPPPPSYQQSIPDLSMEASWISSVRPSFDSSQLSDVSGSEDAEIPQRRVPAMWAARIGLNPPHEALCFENGPSERRPPPPHQRLFNVHASATSLNSQQRFTDATPSSEEPSRRSSVATHIPLPRGLSESFGQHTPPPTARAPCRSQSVSRDESPIPKLRLHSKTSADETSQRASLSAAHLFGKMHSNAPRVEKRPSVDDPHTLVEARYIVMVETRAKFHIPCASAAFYKPGALVIIAHDSAIYLAAVKKCEVSKRQCSSSVLRPATEDDKMWYRRRMVYCSRLLSYLRGLTRSDFHQGYKTYIDQFHFTEVDMSLDAAHVDINYKPAKADQDPRHQSMVNVLHHITGRCRVWFQRRFFPAMRDILSSSDYTPKTEPEKIEAPCTQAKPIRSYAEVVGKKHSN